MTEPTKELKQAMLGLYLLGYRMICRNWAGMFRFRLYAARSMPEMWHGTWMYPDDPMRLNQPELYQYVDYGECIGILPWLQSHGVTVPEV